MRFDSTIVNLCMPYASSDEITMAIEGCVKDGLRHHVDLETCVLPQISLRVLSIYLLQLLYQGRN